MNNQALDSQILEHPPAPPGGLPGRGARMRRPELAQESPGLGLVEAGREGTVLHVAPQLPVERPAK